ncbi:putative MOSC domain [Nitrolancea hollandica Lb]|uniref:Putative MOSC domain n=2 Tax=Nitrolancea hollandica TaxID=1206749 RepID=I4EI15_9BACT|nr:putative MOSC domain [Nitrolancea hollandica Lb]
MAMGQVIKTGRVVVACSSPTTGVPKYPRDAVVVGPEGIVDDYHAGPINKHKKRGEPEPNHRQITILAQEVVEALNKQLDIDLQPGDLAENFLVTGLGDLTDLQAGDRVRIGEVVLEVTGQNRPCATIGVHHPLLVKSIHGRRGIVAVVLVTGIARPGDPVTVERPQDGE